MMQSDSPKVKILLVEDSIDSQVLIQGYLKNFPCQIDVAENGKIALEMFKTCPYDLVLMDIEMPVMDGYRTTQAIRAWEREREQEKGLKKITPIIALTAHTDKASAEKIVVAGCNVRLTKPINKGKLFKIMEDYIQQEEEK